MNIKRNKHNLLIRRDNGRFHDTGIPLEGFLSWHRSSERSMVLMMGITLGMIMGVGIQLVLKFL